jgi:hypothetical protein
MNANLLTPAVPRFSPLQSQRGEVHPEEFTLVGSQVMTASGRRAASEIRVLGGTVWITAEGDSEDYLVTAGGHFRATGRGKIVIESLDPLSRFVMTPLPV